MDRARWDTHLQWKRESRLALKILVTFGFETKYAYLPLKERIESPIFAPFITLIRIADLRYV